MTKIRMAFAATMLGIGFLVACGDDDDDGAAPASSNDGGPTTGDEADAVAPPTTTDACKAYIRAYCDRRKECGIVTPGDNCTDNEAFCPDYLFAPGSTRAIDDVLACAATRRQQSCAEISAGITPACAPAGTQTGGTSCAFVAQCASFTCVTNGLGTCGQCATPTTDGTCSPSCTPDAGAACIACAVNDRCENGRCEPIDAGKDLAAGEACARGSTSAICTPPLRCRATTDNVGYGTCDLAAATGQPCRYDVTGATNPCLTGHCGGPVPGTAVCVDAPGAEGQRCSIANDCAAGLACPDQVCKKALADGQSCTRTEACAPTSYCAYASTTASCKPRLAPGSACSQNDSCPDSMICVGTQLADGGFTPQTCQPPPKVTTKSLPGGPCAKDSDCNYSATCSDAKVCVRAVCQ